MDILGVSAYYQDSAACLIHNGDIVATAQEERFTRKKHDAGFPHNAVRYCLHEGGISLTDLRYLVFYDDEAKRFAEAITMAYHRYHGLDTRIVRIFNTLWSANETKGWPGGVEFYCAGTPGKAAYGFRRWLTDTEFLLCG